MSEFRAALQALVTAFEENPPESIIDPGCYQCSDEMDAGEKAYMCPYHAAYSSAKALLERPEPEPRITREEAMRLIDSYYECKIDPDRTAEAQEDYEACLAAMLRSEPDTFDPFGDVQRAHEAEEMVSVLGMLDADQTACSGAIRVRAFWSQDRKLLISAYVTRDSITLMDDDCHIYEPTGNEQVFTDAPSPPAASDGE